MLVIRYLVYLLLYGLISQINLFIKIVNDNMYIETSIEVLLHADFYNAIL